MRLKNKKTLNKNKQKIRIDRFLVEKGFCESREKARALILSGSVFVKSGCKKEPLRVDKPGTLVNEDSQVFIKEPLKYVSRGGIKLEGALEVFGLSVKDLVCLDIGASTGGFTDCLLQKGAKKVYALDVGKGQLHYKLRKDPRVVVMEKFNARYLEPEMFEEPMDFITIDVSFISLTKILPVLPPLLKKEGEVLALIKPQFELSPKEVKKGIVRDSLLHKKAVDKIWDFSKEIGFIPLGVAESPILGSKGNKEFFIYLKLGQNA